MQTNNLALHEIPAVQHTQTPTYTLSFEDKFFLPRAKSATPAQIPLALLHNNVCGCGVARSALAGAVTEKVGVKWGGGSGCNGLKQAGHWFDQSQGRWLIRDVGQNAAHDFQDAAFVDGRPAGVPPLGMHAHVDTDKPL